MKAFQLLIFVILLSLDLHAQVNVTATAGVNSSSYATLGAAINAINSGTHRGNINVRITGNTTESSRININPSGTGGADYVSITIRPQGGVRTITAGFVDDPLLTLNGCQNVTIDGEYNGGRGLIFVHDGGTTYDYALLFINGTSNNVVRYCDFRARQAHNDRGVITLLANNGMPIQNNIIEYNAIYHAPSYFPKNGIIATTNAGNGAIRNNIIRGNYVYNFYSSGSPTAGIRFDLSFASPGLSYGNQILNNRIFQTTSRNYTSDNTHRGIYLQGGGSYTVSGNVIGYANGSGTGTYSMTTAGSRLRYRGIEMRDLDNIGTHLIENNTISNFYFETTSNENNAAGGNEIGVWCGIVVGEYKTNDIFDDNYNAIIRNNTIGSHTTNDVITVVNGGTSDQSMTKGIYAHFNGNCVIENNRIGGIWAYGVAATNGSNFVGIDVDGSGNKSVNYNLIGSETVAHNIKAGRAGFTTEDTFVDGIYADAWGNNTYNYNVIANMTSYGSGTSSSTGSTNGGIYCYYGTNTFIGNRIHDINIYNDGGFFSFPDPTTGNSVNVQQFGIYNTAGTGQAITDNEIYNLYNHHPSGQLCAVGLMLGEGGNDSYVARNRIYNLWMNSSDLSSIIMGMGVDNNNSTDEWTLANNMISVGQNVTRNYRILAFYANTPARLRLWNNTFLVQGSSNGSANNRTHAAIFIQNDFEAYNNLFFNARTTTGGSAGINVAMSVFNAADVLSVSTDYNVYLASDSIFGRLTLGYLNNNGYSAPYAFTQMSTWRTETGNDAYSWAEHGSGSAPTSYVPNPTDLFVDPDNGDLHINPNHESAWFVNGKGKQINHTGVITDLDGDTRSASVTTGTTDIGADEFTMNLAVAPPNAYIESGSISNGSTTVFSWAQKEIARITWVGTALPSEMWVQYYSGETPPNPVPGAEYSDGYWHIEPKSGTFTGLYTVQINFGPHETGTITTPSLSAILAKHDAGVWVPFFAGTGPLQSQKSYITDPKQIWVTGISSFSDFALTSGFAPLPVQLTHFNGEVTPEGIELRWMLTGTPKEVVYVERSNDALHFTPIAELPARVGETKHLDPHPQAGYNYYRLLIRGNEQEEYSSIIAIWWNESAPTVQVYPNPATSWVKVRGIPSGASIKLLGSNGQLIQQKQDLRAECELNLQGLASGIYLLEIEDKTGKRIEKLMVQK
ncbi:T9SS type A sorting domain-containing protein [Thermonema rossianum]|uniref:T9SS type A sorting domain-containing protein n=1 Tax=Thermonema rossianum TaxID=55505 RepID=UPI0012FBCF63|nr:T9SS type A sorting domain-containing protein [Thermonema rossianum]